MTDEEQAATYWILDLDTGTGMTSGIRMAVASVLYLYKYTGGGDSYSIFQIPVGNYLLSGTRYRYSTSTSPVRIPGYGYPGKLERVLLGVLLCTVL